MVTIRFFAALKEQLDCSSLTIDKTDISDIAALKAHLVDVNPHWKEALLNNALLASVNHQMVNEQCAIKQGDEVAFFPPVTGG
ncbi:molybdopterin synthase sulfur carrier subunit [Thalassotalea agarivorans]|uniref:Molybdopterin synthase sulfur carrier subunit n=2 Tax=Thalassotalea agarivorans TaxID=349064 RepID=A0A1I0AQU7_THASX|nr:molybdopterin synthase sulfur carrier subunit [Thalassotalea agarivorans]